jgi:hypothetical protein
MALPESAAMAQTGMAVPRADTFDIDQSVAEDWGFGA